MNTMGGYIVAHFRKIKTTCGLEAVADHNSRVKIYGPEGEIIGEVPEWLTNLDNAGHNEGEEQHSGETIVKAREKVIREAGLSRKPQKNSSAAIEGVFTASPGSFRNLEKWISFLEDCRDWVNRRYGRENVLQWNTHFDEKTPHLHILMVPVIRDPVKGVKYSSARFLGGREGLREAQDDIFNQVGRKHGLERGERGSEARHTNQAEWQRNLSKTAKELERREKAVTAAETAVEEKKAALMTDTVRMKEAEAEISKNIRARHEALNKAMRDADPTQRMAAKITEHLHGTTKTERDKFWPEFWRRIPGFISGILRSVRETIETERKQTRIERPSRTRGRDDGFEW
jgi:hypothetical protein